jgi:hypothetical protein
MRQWEYMEYNFSEGGKNDFGFKRLNALGKQGWELVNMYVTSGSQGVLKREIQEHPAQEVKRERLHDYNSYEPGY